MSTTHLAGQGVPRPSVIQLAIKDTATLFAAYIPIFTDGGMFIPTLRDYQLGDAVYVLISLPDDAQRYPVAGKVAWVTPARAADGRSQGVGIKLPKDDKSVALKQKIEVILSNYVATDRATQTI